jgi:hypothetical protein
VESKRRGSAILFISPSEFDEPDSAVEREVMSKEQTFRSEDNAFLPLRRRQPVNALRNHVKEIGGGEPSTKKDFETEHSGVFAAPVRPSRIF